MKLITSYVERLNLTIRQGAAYLFRRTICYARRDQRLEDHLQLLRCYYNFVRPHWALKFGREVGTPAIQADLTRRRLVLPQRIGNWSLTSLQQRLVKTGGRLVKHARYYWLLLAESHLTRRLFASMLGRIDGLPLPSG